MRNCLFTHFYLESSRANGGSECRAEVVKIEHPTRGDDTRSWGPPYAPSDDGKSGPGESAYYLSVSLSGLLVLFLLQNISSSAQERIQRESPSPWLKAFSLPVIRVSSLFQLGKIAD